MSKKVWNAEMFKAKNDLRKMYKQKDLRAYHQGRRARKTLSINGCFGNYDVKDYNELSVGTSGGK